MRKFFYYAVFTTLLTVFSFGMVTAQTTTNSGKPTSQVAEPITYQTALAVWTEVQPMFWPGLRMTVNDLVTAYYRDGEGEILKLGENQYRVEMRGCIAVVVLIDSF